MTRTQCLKQKGAVRQIWPNSVHIFLWGRACRGRRPDPVIPSYTRVDTGLTWQWNEKGSITFVGQNLVSDRHSEFVDSIGSAGTTLIKRSAYAKFTWRFCGGREGGRGRCGV